MIYVNKPKLLQENLKKKIGQTGEKKNSFQLRHITTIQSENKAS